MPAQRNTGGPTPTEGPRPSREERAHPTSTGEIASPDSRGGISASPDPARATSLRPAIGRGPGSRVAISRPQARGGRLPVNEGSTTERSLSSDSRERDCPRRQLLPGTDRDDREGNGAQLHSVQREAQRLIGREQDGAPTPPDGNVVNSQPPIIIPNGPGPQPSVLVFAAHTR